MGRKKVRTYAVQTIVLLSYSSMKKVLLFFVLFLFSACSEPAPQSEVSGKSVYDEDLKTWCIDNYEPTFDDCEDQVSSVYDEFVEEGYKKGYAEGYEDAKEEAQQKLEDSIGEICGGTMTCDDYGF